MGLSLRLVDAPPALAAFHAEHLARSLRQRAALAAARVLALPAPIPEPEGLHGPALSVLSPAPLPRLPAPGPVELARAAVADYRACFPRAAEPDGYIRPNAREIVRAVAAFYRVTPADIFGRSRKLRIAYARHIAVYLCRRVALRAEGADRQLCRLSFPTLGTFFGGRDHSTVIHAYTRVDWLVRAPGAPTAREICGLLQALGVIQ